MWKKPGKRTSDIAVCSLLFLILFFWTFTSRFSYLTLDYPVTEALGTYELDSVIGLDLFQ